MYMVHRCPTLLHLMWFGETKIVSASPDDTITIINFWWQYSSDYGDNLAIFSFWQLWLEAYQEDPGTIIICLPSVVSQEQTVLGFWCYHSILNW